MSAEWIIAQAKELNRRHGVECIFIDYLQLMACDTDSGSKHYGLSAAVKQLKNFAKSSNMSIIILAQIHEDGRIRDVGDADRDAGAIVRITLDKDQVDDDGLMPAVFEVTKNRHGKCGKYTSIFDSKHVKFF
jgi:replicative DNA helicase